MDVVGTIKKTGKMMEQALTGEAPSDSETDILDTLKAEHEEVKGLLKKLVESQSGRERKSLVTKIKSALVPHARAEEKVLYDAILALRDKQSRIDGEEGYLEHGLADKMLGKLGNLTPMSTEFSAAAKVLKELLEHHIGEEERNVWADARKSFSTDKRMAMNLRYQAAKKKVRVP